MAAPPFHGEGEIHIWTVINGLELAFGLFQLRMDDAYHHKCINGRNALHWGFVCSAHEIFCSLVLVGFVHGLTLVKCFV